MISTAGRRKKKKHKQNCGSHSKVRGSVTEIPKTGTRETCTPMHHVLPHLSCVSPVSTGVFSRQFKAAEAAGQCGSWQHAGEERYSTRHLLCQTRCLQTDTPDTDVSAHLALAHGDCFCTNEPPCSQTASRMFYWTYTFNWTCQSDISSFIVTACVNKYPTAFLSWYLFILSGLLYSDVSLYGCRILCS